MIVVMRYPQTALGVLAALLLSTTAACTAELTSDLKVDGESFVPTSCRAGQVNSFSGVDLIDDSGRTLRLVQSTTNLPSAIVLGGQAPVDLGSCGAMTVTRQSSTVNDITNVMGDATLKCEADGHSVVGTISFKNCH